MPALMFKYILSMVVVCGREYEAELPKYHTILLLANTFVFPTNNLNCAVAHPHKFKNNLKWRHELHQQ